jgi:hypothetical protein
MNNIMGYGQRITAARFRRGLAFAAGLWLLTLLASCKVYSFKDISIPPDVKTIRINFIENKARLVNPQLGPQLTDQLRQKITNQTRLTVINSDAAQYDVSAYITDYTVTTAGVSNQQAATDRLTVSVHIIFKNRTEGKPKDFEADISHSFDYGANNTLTQEEPVLMPLILSNLTDEIFNRLFSNW